MFNMNIEESEAKLRGYGGYAVTIIDNFMIPLRDGIHLSAKFWFPQINVSDCGFKDSKSYIFYEPKDAAQSDHYPAVLEYIPYRKNDYTAKRDHLRHPWMASHGYVVIRVDMRGSGDSEGLYFDEYLLQEQEDCVDVLKWIGQQTWSNNAVGMYGKSWGGFNGLQVAYHQPAELKAVISLYSTDDRYATDSHHDGGCLTGDAMISWASYTFGWNARAPDPRVTPDWKSVWLNRLKNASDPWGPKWMKHELRDEYWQHGSICEDYSRITCPVLVMGGWKDPYTDSVFRMVGNLVNVRGVIGPWPHEWPDNCATGPNIEYLQVCLQWWDYHLKGKANSAMDEPKFRIYLQDSYAPSALIKYRPGKWVYTTGWPDPNSISAQHYAFNSHVLVETTKSDGESQSEESWDRVPFSLQCGQTQGEWLDFGFPIAPCDQRLSDAHSLQLSTHPLQEELPILGFPKLHCTVKVLNHDKAILAARLVDVAPTGDSSLITYGYLNLTHREGHEPGKVALLEPNKEYSIQLQFHAASYVVPVGHKLRLSISACNWPGVWPSSKAVHMEILNGFRSNRPLSTLELPLAKDGIQPYSNPLFETSNPNISTALPIEYKTEPIHEMQNLHDQANNKLIRKIVHDSGLEFHTSLGLITQHKFKETNEITGNDPLSAIAKTEHDNVMEYPDVLDDDGQPIKIRICTESELRATERSFLYDNKLTCYLNNESYHGVLSVDWFKKETRLYKDNDSADQKVFHGYTIYTQEPMTFVGRSRSDQ